MEGNSDTLSNNFDTDTLDFGHLSQTVFKIYISGYKNAQNVGDDDGNPPTNHWAAFLQLSEASSVRLDMAPGYGSDGLRGKIELASKEYVSTRNAIKTLSFALEIPTTVKAILDIIVSNGRDKYMFTEEEEGCRFWIWTLLSDLEAAGIVSKGSADATLEAVSYYWRTPQGTDANPLKEGRFY
ncbi:MAG: hypothetical protein M4579_002901 [Chaenotheca gracillima]|nr:MAG: hypothetical protein M4579_002901 [Chaenotheca gracillima]